MTIDPNSSPDTQHRAEQNGSQNDPLSISKPSKAEISREKTAASFAPSLSGNAQSFASSLTTIRPAISLILLVAIVVLIAGLWINSFWLVLAGAIVTLILSMRVLYPVLRPIFAELVSDQEGSIFIASVGLTFVLIGFLKLVGFGNTLAIWYKQLDWDAIGALGEVFGALGQIFIAILAVYIAWRQYVISKDLTIQQNTITQQQTIDTYFQGISELVLDEEGLLEDWPQERAIAEGRTAAILSSVDGSGKAKILRFLSRAKLLSPLKRDRRLGRAILDGSGGYAEDRSYGTRVIDLGVMLAGANLTSTDLRWTDLSEANLIRANLTCCDLVKANLSRTILYSANLQGADLNGARLFYGTAENASPRSRTDPPDYKTGAQTGAVVENADFTNAEDMSPEQHYYCCAWGGSKTRSTIPGGCEGIPNKLGR
jgi:uncharacterized protein YjbI with pentapeptide repeats